MASISSSSKVAPAPDSPSAVQFSPTRTSPTKRPISSAHNALTSIPESQSITGITKTPQNRPTNKATLIVIQPKPNHTPGVAQGKKKLPQERATALEDLMLTSPIFKELLSSPESIKKEIYGSCLDEAIAAVIANRAQREAERIREEENKKREEEERRIRKAWERREKAYSMLPDLAQGFRVSTLEIRAEFTSHQKKVTGKWEREVLESYQKAFEEDFNSVEQALPPLNGHSLLVKVLPDSVVERMIRVSEMQRTVDGVSEQERVAMYGSKHPVFSSVEEFLNYRELLRRHSRIAGRNAFRFLKYSPALLGCSHKVNKVLTCYVTPRLATAFPDNQSKQNHVFDCLLSKIVEFIYPIDREKDIEKDIEFDLKRNGEQLRALIGTKDNVSIRNQTISQALDGHVRRDLIQAVVGVMETFKLFAF